MYSEHRKLSFQEFLDESRIQAGLEEKAESPSASKGTDPRCGMSWGGLCQVFQCIQPKEPCDKDDDDRVSHATSTDLGHWGLSSRNSSLADVSGSMWPAVLAKPLVCRLEDVADPITDADFQVVQEKWRLSHEAMYITKTAVSGKDPYGWHRIYNKHVKSGHCVVWDRKIPKTAIREYRTHFNGPKLSGLRVFQFHADDNYRSGNDRFTIALRHVGTIGSATRALWWQVKFPPPMKNRDYVFFNRWKVDEKTGDILWIQRAGVLEGSEDKVKESSRFIRVLKYKMEVIFKKTSTGGCESWSFYHEDMRGQVPKVIVRWVFKIAVPHFLNHLPDFVEDYNQWERNGNPTLLVPGWTPNVHPSEPLVPSPKPGSSPPKTISGGARSSTRKRSPPRRKKPAKKN